MKKVMIGILILIPVIILLIVAAVSSLVSINAYISVESVGIDILKDGVSFVELDLSQTDANKNKIPYKLEDYLKVNVMPAHATAKNSFTWSIENLKCYDSVYQAKYDYYMEHKDDSDFNGEVVYPAAMLVDPQGNMTESGSAGRLVINAYCTFYLKVTAETKSARVYVYVSGLDVETVIIHGSGEYTVGDSEILSAYFNPLDSIVNDLQWFSSDESVARVDKNGVLTATGAGSASISVKAQCYSNENYYITSEQFIVNVTEGVSSKYGAHVYTELTSFTAEDMGLGEIDAARCSQNVAINGELISITSGGSATIAVKGSDALFTVYVVDDDNKIKIDNRGIYDYSDASGFVFSMGDMEYPMRASWLSDTKKGVPDVEWSSSNTDVADIDENGIIVIKNTGLSVIKAVYTVGEKIYEDSFELNAQNKISSIELQISNETLAVGLARETVLGSKRYIYQGDSLTNDTKSNYIDIRFEMPVEPMDADELEVFYSKFDFEVLVGEGLAYFESNRLIFNPEAIKQKLMLSNEDSDKIIEKLPIKIRISAKYPKYIYDTRFSTAEIDITVTDGIMCYTYAEVMQAQGEIRDNVISREGEIICLGANIEFPNAGKQTVGADAQVRAIRSIYGNDYSISAAMYEMSQHEAVVRVLADNVTISNLTVRANRLEDESIIYDKDEDKLTGYGVRFDKDNADYNRCLNARIEFSTVENCLTMFGIINADVVIEGCIIRNSAAAGMYIPTGINTNTNGESVASYSDITIKNCVMSNLIGTAMSFYYSGYSKTTNAEGKPVDRDVTEFIARGEITTFKQEGFLDIYNWQRADIASLIDTGDEKINNLIQGFSSNVLPTAPSLKDFRVDSVDGAYLHMGIITSGNFQNSEKSYFADFASFEDKRFKVVDVNKVIRDGIPIPGFELLDAELYAYDNLVKDILPKYEYEVNAKFIDRLHGIGL